MTAEWDKHIYCEYKVCDLKMCHLGECLQRSALCSDSPSAFIASLRPLVVGEIKAEMLLEPARPAALNNTVNWQNRID